MSQSLMDDMTGESCPNCGMDVIHDTTDCTDRMLFHNEGEKERSYCRFFDVVEEPAVPYLRDDGNFAARFYQAKQNSELSYRELADLFEVHESSVEHWVMGTYEPADENRVAVEEWIENHE